MGGVHGLLNVLNIVALPFSLFFLSYIPTSLPSFVIRRSLFTMPFVYRTPLPANVSTTSSLHPPTPLNSTPSSNSASMSNFPSSLHLVSSTRIDQPTLQTVSQRMIEISKERAAKRKREREARQRGCFAESFEFVSVSGIGSSMGDESIVSSAESSLDMNTSSSYRSTTSSASVPKFDSPDSIIRGNIPSQGIKPATTVNTGIPQAQVQIQGSTEQPPLSDIHGPPRDDIAPSLDPVHGVGSSLLPTPVPASTSIGEVEVDDDADLKRLMNQAENMLKIADTPVTVGFEPHSQPQSRIKFDNRDTTTGNVSQDVRGVGVDVIDGRR
jgi:hypothetical protein